VAFRGAEKDVFCRIPVLRVGDHAFRVHGTVNDLGHFMVLLGQGNQVREFFGVQADGPSPRLPMDAYIGDFLKPPGRHLVEVL
jgi:hypothetical protein